MLQNLSESVVSEALSMVCEDFDSAAIVDRQGQIYFLKYESLADLGTLGAAAKTALQYFPVKLGDLVILNDPYAGGTLLSTVALLTALTDQFFLIARKGFRPQLILAKRIEEEGLRIPPTPLASNFQIQDPILQAISSHPDAPQDFENQIRIFAKCLFAQAEVFQNFSARKILDHLHLQKLVASTRQLALSLVSEKAFGEAEIETELASGEILRTRVELAAEGLHVNFSGTRASQRLCLTDAATLGAVTGAFLAFLEKPIPLNTGSLGLLQVESPLGCFLNAKYPSPTFLGMTEGTSFVAHSVLKALKKLSPQSEAAEPACLPLFLNLDFGNQKKFFDSLHGGGGGSASHAGADAVNFWGRNRLETSVEEIERRFPLLVRQMSLRTASGGLGHFRGGDGITKEYELLARAELCYLSTREKKTNRGALGAQSGESPSLCLIRKNGDKLNLEDGFGRVFLEIGDRVLMSSAGGGGYRKSESPKN